MCDMSTADKPHAQRECMEEKISITILVALQYCIKRADSFLILQPDEL